MANFGPITIALFDSGVGGLSVLRELEALSFKDAGSRPLRFVYLADTARCPYGNRPKEEIERFVAEIVQFLFQKQADAVVMACNTSAALALDTARRQGEVPVFDLIGPVCEHIAQRKINVGVMATASTVKSRAFSRGIQSLSPELKVLEIACPDLVPLVESGQISGAETALCLSKYVDQLVSAQVEAVVMGCTHFPFLAAALRELLPGHIEIIDPAKFVAANLEAYLGGRQTANLEEPRPVPIKEIYVTGSAANFMQAAATCLGYEHDLVFDIAVEDLAALPAPTPQVVSQAVASPGDAAGSLP